MTNPMQLAKLLGTNLKVIRDVHGLSTDDVAREARAVGLKWNTGTVSAFEKGNSSPTAPKLIALCAALERACPGHQFGLPDLVDAGVVDSDQPIEISDHLVMSAAGVAEMVKGMPFDLVRDHHVQPASYGGREIPSGKSGTAWAEELVAVNQNVRQFTEAEFRAAKDLGVTPESFAAVAYRMWGHSFTVERDSRAGDEATAQKLGRITRALKSEMTAEISNGDD